MFQNHLNLTANDILEKEFKIDTRGYRLKEVDQYLDLVIQDYKTFIKIIEQLSKENQKLNDEILKLKQDLRDASIQTEIAKASPSNTSNLDILKRLSNLEKIIYGHSEKEEKEEYHFRQTLYNYYIEESPCSQKL